MKAKRTKKVERRGKWSRDPWIRILELIHPMSDAEKIRCLRATNDFFIAQIESKRAKS